MRRVPYAEMARVVKRVDPPHNCLDVIAEDIDEDLSNFDLGTVVACRRTCGKFYQRYCSSNGSAPWIEVRQVGEVFERV